MNRLWKFIQTSLDRSIWFRIFIAFIIAYFSLLIFDLTELANSGVEACEPRLSVKCITRKTIGILTIENLEGFGLLLAANLYVLESRQRRRQSQYESWKVIDAAAGVETSYARFRALQELNEDRISLRGIDIPGVDLEGINLEGADLRDADLRGVNLKQSKLRGANLKGANLGRDKDNKFANLEDADLSNADLSSSNLEGANLTGANLDYVYLRDAIIDYSTQIPAKQLLVWKILNQPKKIRNLRRIDLERTNLSNADLSGMDFRRASFKKANLRNSDLSKAKIIDADFTDADLSGTLMGKQKGFDRNITTSNANSSWFKPQNRLRKVNSKRV